MIAYTTYTDLLRQVTKAETKIELNKATPEDIEFYFAYVRELEAKVAELKEQLADLEE